MTHRQLLLVVLLSAAGFAATGSSYAQQLLNPLIADPVITFSVELNEAASSTRRDLERAEAFLKNQQWDEAIETFRGAMEEESDRVLAVNYGSEDPDPFAVHIAVRDYCQMRLAQLAIDAPEALVLYRQRVDPVARQWLEQAKASQDRELLERIVRTMFASSFGDDALFMLGEMELTRGNLATARGLWERISPNLRTPVDRDAPPAAQGGQPLWLALVGVDLDEHWKDLAPILQNQNSPGGWFAYPDTDLNLADVRSRLVLVSIVEGSLDRAQFELEVLARLHPEAEGAIGRNSGKLHELLAALLEQSRTWPEIAPASDWPTFAGAQNRNRRAEREIDVGRMLWSRSFERTYQSGDDGGDDFAFPGLTPERPATQQPPVPLLSYHPAVVGDVVLYNDSRRIYGLRLSTGEPAWPLGVEGQQIGVIYDPSLPLPFALDASLGRRDLGAPRFTLNVQGDRLTARMGSPVTGETPGSLGSANNPGYLATLDFQTLKPLHTPIRSDGPEWAFEGTPVTDGVRLYVAMRHSEIRAVSYIACYEMQTGERLWRRKICSAETLAQSLQRREISHNLLTLAEGTLYYNTNLGAIAAISIPDGDVKWVTRYPRISRLRGEERQDPRFLRDLNPCVFHNGIVLAFPGDSNQIFALDAMSGQFLWATPEESTPDVAHLLGVAGDNLIVSGAYLYWLNAYSGRFLAQFPPNAQFSHGLSLPDPHGAGRGVLAGDAIYWPTQTNTDAASRTGALSIQVIDAQLRRTGRTWQPQLRREIELASRVPGIPLEGANIIISSGVMLLATPKHLVAFGE
jgi:outer membrane protein assembly factor BamB